MKLICQTVAAVALWGSLASGFATGAGGPPLPPVESVLERLVEASPKAAANDQEFKERYHFTRSKTTAVRNAKGEIKQRDVKTRTNSPSLRPAGDRPASTEARSGERGPPARKSDFALDRDFLQRFEFSLVGREQINDRPALMLDFSPAAKKWPERDFKDRIINQVAGRVWVDEAEFVLVKADLRLTGKVNIVAGLAGAISHFTLTFQRTRTPEGLWFTRRLDWHLDGREVLVRRTMESQEEITGVQLVR